MNNLNIIDQFMQTFTSYIDSGFGLLNGDVMALSSVLIAIDITLAGLFWVLDGEVNVIATLIKKTLYIGAFAYILNNFSMLANVIFNSFSSLGLEVTNNSLTAQDLLSPGKLASVGFQAAWPLMQQVGSLMGFTSVFTHLATIIVLLFAWFIVILSFFILAVQLFITVIEFKLTTLAGFVLVPFALWNKTSFLAERVLGNVVSSGVKVMVLAVIVGIGSTLFGSFTNATQGQQPTIAGAMSLVLAAITLFGLGIFGPAIAAGLVSGAPQLGAGAAIGTAGALAGAAIVAGGAGFGAARLAGSGGLAAIRAGTALGAGASTAYGFAQATSGAEGLAGIGAGLSGVARAGAGAARQSGRSMTDRFGQSLSESSAAGRRAAWRATGGSSASADGENPASASSSNENTPAWVRQLRAEHRRRAHVQTTMQAIREGDRPGSGVTPDLSEE